MTSSNLFTKFFTTIFDGYKKLLLTSPIKTKMISSGLIALFGDTLCQKIIEKKSDQDYSRTLRQSTVSCLYGAPLGHFWFGTLLPKIINPFKQMPLRIAASVILDNTIFTSYNIATNVFLLEFLKTGQVDQSIKNVQSKFLTILLNSIKFWCVVSCFNHTFIPMHFKVVVGNLCGIIWQIYMSYMVNMEGKEVEKMPVQLDSPLLANIDLVEP